MPVDPTQEVTADITTTVRRTLKNSDMTSIKFYRTEAAGPVHVEIRIQIDDGEGVSQCMLSEISTAAERTALASIANKAHVLAATNAGFP